MTARHEWLSTAGLKKFARTAIVGTAVTAVALSLTPIGPAALADPTDRPDTVAEAKALVKKLEQESAGLDQKYVEAQQKYEKAKKSLAAKKRKVAEQQTEVAELRKAVAAIALAQYQSRGVDTTTKLIVSPSPEALMRDLSLQQRMSVRQRTTLQDYQTKLANLGDLQRAAAADAAAMKTATEEMAAARKASEAKLDEAEQILQQLTEAQRRRLEAERRAAAEAARQAAEAANTDANTDADNDNDNDDNATSNRSDNETSRSKKRTSAPKSEPAPAVSGRAAAAVASARSKVGAPYVYGGTGPGYDCSGLTMTSWAAAGVSIGRTTWAQWGRLTPISRGQLRPGDLVFYYSGISHVAIYVGNGTIIHAPNSRSVVRYDSIDSMPIAGYRRV